jgi:hypothetical protein
LSRCCTVGCLNTLHRNKGIEALVVGDWSGDEGHSGVDNRNAIGEALCAVLRDTKFRILNAVC